MSLVDYPLFSWVVVIHSLHVSSFREAHHQEILFPVQSASGIVYNLCCRPPVLYNDARNSECKKNAFQNWHTFYWFWRFADRASQNIYFSNYPTWCTKFCFTISFISCPYMFRAHVLIIRRSKLHYTASGIITPTECDDTRGCVMQFWNM